MVYLCKVATDLVWFGMVWFLLDDISRPMMEKVQLARGISEFLKAA